MLSSIELAHTGRRTTRLGFGCSGTMGATGRKASLKILACAYDAGVRHFDVAPMYGYGEAEACLGEGATVTTKFGIPPEHKQRWKIALRRWGREAVRYVPALRERLRKTSAGAGGSIRKNLFQVAEANKSLNESLLALRRDHIDLWLLHEATAPDLQDELLLRFMEDAVAAGKIGTFGVGTERQWIPALQAERADYCRVLQFEWSVFDAVLPPTSEFRVHHRSLTEAFHHRHQWLVSDPARCSAWSKAVDRDLRRPTELAALMLKASLEANPESIVLFSSKTPHHILANVALSQDESLRAPALLLHRLIQNEIAAGASIAPM